MCFHRNNSLFELFRLEEKGKRASSLNETVCLLGLRSNNQRTHTKHSCCGLTTDISQVIQSIVIEGNDERLFGLHSKVCVKNSVSVCVCLYSLCIFPQKIQLFSCRMKLTPFHRHFKSN